MPELPEVETIRRSLQLVQGAQIESIEIFRPEIIRREDYDPQLICGDSILQIERRGKFLVLGLTTGLNLIVHMGMSGRFYVSEEEAELTEPHIHVVVHLDQGKKLIYQDPRRFGGLWFVRDTRSFFSRMGPEPLSRSFNSSYLAKVLKGRKAPIKNLLLNQNLIAGIGNIYADEALFAARIRPDRAAGTLAPEEVARLCRAIKKILRTSITRRGTTFRDYRDGYNRKGEFQNYLKVYGKTNTPCPVCGNLLVMARIGGRSSHYCEKCQK